MIKPRRIFLILIALFFFQSVVAGDLYPFSSNAKKVKFNTLTNQLRCLVCQNENLASSNAPLAWDLRNQIYDMVKQGKSSKEIILYLTNRYGDFILFKPPFNKETLFLWSAPFLLIIIGFFILFYFIKQRRFNALVSMPLSTEEANKIKELLKS